LPFEKKTWKSLDELDAGVCDGMTYEEIEVSRNTIARWAVHADQASKNTLKTTFLETKTSSTTGIEEGSLIEMSWSDSSPLSWSWNDRRIS